MANYDSVDLDFTWDGDYRVADDGDLMDTSDDYTRSFVNEITTVVKADVLDWELDPTIGSTLSDFVGEANTRDNGEAIEERVRLSLIDAGIVDPEDLFVRVIPLSIHRIMISISVLTLATPNNRLSTGEPIIVTLVFDTTEGGIFVQPISKMREEQTL